MAEDDKWVGGGGGGSSGDSGGGSSVSGSSVSGSSSSSSASSASASGTDKPSGGEGSGAPQKSKTNLYEDLEPKLKAAFRTEWDGLRGDRPKRWFTSLMYKRTYKEIFDEFLAGPHEDNWTALTQDKQSAEAQQQTEQQKEQTQQQTM